MLFCNRLNKELIFPAHPQEWNTQLFSCRWLCNRAPQANTRILFCSEIPLRWWSVYNTVWILSYTPIYDRGLLLIGRDYREVGGYKHNSGNTCADACVRVCVEGGGEGENGFLPTLGSQNSRTHRHRWLWVDWECVWQTCPYKPNSSNHLGLTLHQPIRIQEKEGWEKLGGQREGKLEETLPLLQPRGLETINQN